MPGTAAGLRGRGDTVSGKLVLDVVTEHGTVSYAPRVAADWYWEY